MLANLDSWLTLSQRSDGPDTTNSGNYVHSSIDDGGSYKHRSCCIYILSVGLL